MAYYGPMCLLGGLKFELMGFLGSLECHLSQKKNKTKNKELQYLSWTKSKAMDFMKYWYN